MIWKDLRLRGSKFKKLSIDKHIISFEHMLSSSLLVTRFRSELLYFQSK
ncbi:unnamed protein product [Thelazia callipaeda]|uniref:Uncharacterized protein n=1 Tax=Thelazia callipaeda TaxID=103827 RepID=A0A0N5CTL0_THECL|nr:unnamed protein product [Thelazia callipaeda]